MEMRDLLEKMMKFAGEKVGQKPGDQWRGTDKAPPGKKLVGDSILKDLSKGKTPKSKEQELSEEFQAFLEAEFKDTVDKRPARKNARPARGHEPNPGYKTVKADEAAGKGIDYHDQIPIKSVMQGLKVDYNRKTNQTILSYRGKPIETFIYDGIPTLGHFDVAVDHKIAELMKLGKIPKMPSLPRNRSSQPQTYNLDQEYSHGIDLPKNVQQQMFQQHDQDTENYGMVSVSNPAKWANVNAKKEKEKEKQQKVAESSMSEKDIELQDYRSMSHKEFQTAYGMTKTEWINKNKSLVIQNPKLKQALGLDEGTEQDPIVAKVVKQMRPGLTGLNMGNEAFLYFAYEIGKQRAREMWSDYLPAIRDAYEQGLNEGWESGPEEYQEPYDDADDAYDRQRQEKIDTEAEKEWAKLPKVSTYKLVGRGPNMEPNYEFGGKEYDTLEAAIEARKQLMADPETPHPEHIGISTLTRVVDKKQTDENSVTTPQNKAHADQMMKDLTKLQTDVPNPDPELAATIARRKDILAKQTKDLDMEESRGHKIISTKLKDIERSKKFASGELKIPTPQERQAQLKKLEKEPKQVKELMAPQGTANQTMQQKTQAQDPKQAQAVAQATQAMKSATGSSAPATTLAKALDTASQGRPVQGQEAAALQPLMKDMATVAQDPKLSGQFKSFVNQINQAQLKQK
jgi:hypothetical protein